MAKYTLEQAIRDYSSELKTAKQWKAFGQTEVPAGTAGEELAAGRENVPIDEYIARWETGLHELESGEVDPEDYNY